MIAAYPMVGAAILVDVGLGTWVVIEGVSREWRRASSMALGGLAGLLIGSGTCFAVLVAAFEARARF